MLCFEVDDEDIDAAFNDDGSFRWLSVFMYFDSTDPKQNPQRRVQARLRLIDLAFRIPIGTVAQRLDVCHATLTRGFKMVGLD